MLQLSNLSEIQSHNILSSGQASQSVALQISISFENCSCNLCIGIVLLIYTRLRSNMNYKMYLYLYPSNPTILYSYQSLDHFRSGQSKLGLLPHQFRDYGPVAQSLVGDKFWLRATSTLLLRKAIQLTSE